MKKNNFDKIILKIVFFLTYLFYVKVKWAADFISNSYNFENEDSSHREQKK